MPDDLAELIERLEAKIERRSRVLAERRGYTLEGHVCPRCMKLYPVTNGNDLGCCHCGAAARSRENERP